MVALDFIAPVFFEAVFHVKNVACRVEAGSCAEGCQSALMRGTLNRKSQTLAGLASHIGGHQRGPKPVDIDASTTTVFHKFRPASSETICIGMDRAAA
jgi:hypothetical protein